MPPKGAKINDNQNLLPLIVNGKLAGKEKWIILNGNVWVKGLLLSVQRLNLYGSKKKTSRRNKANERFK